MKKILVTGKADKRVISYPLMHICNYSGKTCLITDDVNYKRLYGGYEKTGDIDNVHIEIIPPVSPDEDLSELFQEKEEYGYDILILVLDSYLADGMDLIYIIGNRIRTFMGIEIEEVMEEHQNTTAFAVSLVKHPVSAGVIPFTWNIYDFVYLCTVEETRKLQPPKNKKIVELLQSTICTSVDIPVSTYNGLSGRTKSKKKKK